MRLDGLHHSSRCPHSTFPHNTPAQHPMNTAAATLSLLASLASSPPPAKKLIIVSNADTKIIKSGHKLAVEEVLELFQSFLGVFYVSLVPFDLTPLQELIKLKGQSRALFFLLFFLNIWRFLWSFSASCILFLFLFQETIFFIFIKVGIALRMGMSFLGIIGFNPFKRSFLSYSLAIILHCNVMLIWLAPYIFFGTPR